MSRGFIKIIGRIMGRQKIKSMIVSFLLKKEWKIDQHTPKAQRKIVFTYEFGPTTKKILFLYV